jgi:predicted RNase H-like HicB family nuclease
MKCAVVTNLGSQEGYVARIPGFRGLLATGRTKREALSELNDALADWVTLAVKRGICLPAVGEKRLSMLSVA